MILFSLCCCLFLHHHHHHPASPFFSLSCCSLLIWLCNLNLPLPFCFYFLRCSFIFTLLLPTRYFPFLLPFPPFHFKITHCCFLWRELALVTCFVACTHTRCFFLWCALTSIAFLCVACTRTHYVDSWHALARNFFCGVHSHALLFLWCALTSIAFLCVTCTRTHCVDSWHALARIFFWWRTLARIAFVLMCTRTHWFLLSHIALICDVHSHTHYFFVSCTCTQCFFCDVRSHALFVMGCTHTHYFNLWRALARFFFFVTFVWSRLDNLSMPSTCTM